MKGGSYVVKGYINDVIKLIIVEVYFDIYEYVWLGRLRLIVRGIISGYFFYVICIIFEEEGK